MFVTTLKGNINVACSEGAVRLLRKRPDEIIGHSVVSFDCGRNNDQVTEVHETIVNFSGAIRTNTTFRRGDGTLVWVEAHVSPCIYRRTLHAMAMVLPIEEIEATRGEAVTAASSQGSVVVSCAWCGRVRHLAGEWRDAPGLEWATLPISHGICDLCEQKFRLQLGAQQL